MADQAAAGWAVLDYQPGNPELPTLPTPGDPSLGGLSEFGNIADLVFAVQAEERMEVHAAQGGDGFAAWYLGKLWLTPGEPKTGEGAEPSAGTCIYCRAKS